MTKPIEIISAALKDIGALEAGETPTPEAAADALFMLNDLVDQWSNENMMVFNVTEIIFTLISGQVQYTLGPNPSTQNFVGAQFTGSINNDILTVSGILSGAVAQGQTVSGTGVTTGTKIINNITGAGGNGDHWIEDMKQGTQGSFSVMCSRLTGPTYSLMAVLNSRGKLISSRS